MATTRLLDHFSALDDPRRPRKVTYPLPEVLLIVLCAAIALSFIPILVDKYVRPL